MKVAISCAFNENAIWALSRYASSRDMLTARAVPRWDLTADAARRLRRLAQRSDALSDFALRKQLRLAESALPEDVPVSRASELLRIAGGRFKTPLTPHLGFYAWKVLFDRKASRILRGQDIDVLIGMPGSSERTFRQSPDPLKVFHATDTHPRIRNAALERVYGARGRGESYTRALVGRIQDELDLADVVLTPSRQSAVGMINEGIPAEKILTVPYSVDLTRFHGTADFDGDAGRRRRPRLLYVGQVSMLKGVPLLLDAVRGLDVDLTLVGQVFDRSVLHRVPDNVKVTGVLSPADLAHRYNEHDAFVLPTLNDAFALVLLEAAACGLPIVTTTAAGAAEVLPEEHDIIPPGDVSALRVALSKVAPLGRDDRQAVAARFRDQAQYMLASWDEYASHVFDALTARSRLRQGTSGR